MWNNYFNVYLYHTYKWQRIINHCDIDGISYCRILLLTNTRTFTNATTFSVENRLLRNEKSGKGFALSDSIPQSNQAPFSWIFAPFFDTSFQSARLNFSHWNNTEKNCTFSLFETSVNGNVTFAYIITFHFHSVYINQGTKSHLFVCFIDFSAAFDTIWRRALFYKMYHNGIGGRIFNVIHNMYDSISFAIKHANKITDDFTTSVGAKQGCILSPFLFNLYLSDLPEIFTDLCDPVILNDSKLSCLMYADDLIIISKSAKKGLQCALNNLYSYCKRWKLLVNIDKSNIMIFKQKRSYIR